jgi:protein-S-isoprenylcysteine O-methyltransferase Ste14
MLIHAFRYIILNFCVIINYWSIVSPNEVTIFPTFFDLWKQRKNRDNEMGTLEGDNQIPGGTFRYFNLQRNVSTFLFFVLALYNSYKFPYFLTNFELFFVFILIIGFVLRMWCFSELDQFFTFGLGIRKNHQLIKTGPYRFLIHPSYTGQFMTMIALWTLLIINNSYIGFIFYCLTLFYSLYNLKFRIEIEENMMKTHFGIEYENYLKLRYKIIPFVF